MIAVVVVAAFLFVIIPAGLTHCTMVVMGWRDPRLRLLVFIVMGFLVWEFVNGRGPGAPSHVATYSAPRSGTHSD